MKKPHRYIITGVDENGAPAPVIANVTCTNESGSFSTFLAIEGVHGYVRNQREEGFTVEVDPLFEVPEVMQQYWAEYFLQKRSK
jgi:hypothetical protein